MGSKVTNNSYIKLLEARVCQLEGEVRLIHRKLRSQELSRFELVKAAVLEVLNGNRMKITFDETDQSVHTDVHNSYGNRSYSGGLSSPERTPSHIRHPYAHSEVVKQVTSRRSGLHSKTRGSTNSIASRSVKTLSESEEVSDNPESGNDFVTHDDPLVSSDEDYTPSTSKDTKVARRKRSHSNGIKMETDNQREGYEHVDEMVEVINNDDEPECPPPTPKRICQPRQRKSRAGTPRKSNYSLYRSFQSAAEVADFLKNDVSCRIRTRKVTPRGLRAFYNCKNEGTCLYRQYVLYPDDPEEMIQLYKTTECHNHPVIPFGIADPVRARIEELVHDGIVETNVITERLLANGIPKIQKQYLDNFLSTLL